MLQGEKACQNDLKKQPPPGSVESRTGTFNAAEPEKACQNMI
jgi:hypothetical protein